MSKRSNQSDKGQNTPDEQNNGTPVTSSDSDRKRPTPPVIRKKSGVSESEEANEGTATELEVTVPEAPEDLDTDAEVEEPQVAPKSKTETQRTASKDEDTQPVEEEEEVVDEVDIDREDEYLDEEDWPGDLEDADDADDADDFDYDEVEGEADTPEKGAKFAALKEKVSDTATQLREKIAPAFEHGKQKLAETSQTVKEKAEERYEWYQEQPEEKKKQINIIGAAVTAGALVAMTVSFFIWNSGSNSSSSQISDAPADPTVTAVDPSATSFGSDSNSSAPQSESSVAQAEDASKPFVPGMYVVTASDELLIRSAPEKTQSTIRGYVAAGEPICIAGNEAILGGGNYFAVTASKQYVASEFLQPKTDANGQIESCGS